MVNGMVRFSSAGVALFGSDERVLHRGRHRLYPIFREAASGAEPYPR